MCVLHNILLHLLHFPMTYPGMPKTWPLWIVVIHICSSDPSKSIDWKIPWAFPRRNSSKTQIWESSLLWDSKQWWSPVALHLTRDGITLFTCISVMIPKRHLSLMRWEYLWFRSFQSYELEVFWQRWGWILPTWPLGIIRISYLLEMRA